MRPYIDALRTLVQSKPGHSVTEESVIQLLYEAYIHTNPPEDAAIKEAFEELYSTMNGMSLQEMDHILDPFCTLCSTNEQIGFTAGIKLGFLLAQELSE